MDHTRPKPFGHLNSLILQMALAICLSLSLDVRLWAVQTETPASTPAEFTELRVVPLQTTPVNELRPQAEQATPAQDLPAQPTTEQITAPNATIQPAGTTAGTPANAAAPTTTNAGLPTVSVNDTVTLRENANLRLEQLRGETETRVELREQLTKLYQQIQVDAAAAEQAAQQRDNWLARIAIAPQDLEQARELKKNGGAEVDTLSRQDLDFVSFDEGQQRLRNLEAILATAAAERSKLNESIAFRESRRKELPQLISDTKARLEELTARPAGEIGNEEPSVVEARGWASLAQRLALEEQVAALESEQRLIEAEAQLLPLRLELAQNIEKIQQERVRRINDELNRIRQNRILTQRSDLYELLQQLPEEMRPPGEQLLERTEQWRALTERQADLTQELEASQATLARWKDQLSRIEARVNPTAGAAESSGFNSWVGLMLRKQRGELPDLNQLKSSIRGYREQMQKTDSLLFEIEENLSSLRAQLSQLDSSASAAKAASPQQPLGELLIKGEEVLQGMRGDADEYLNDLYQIADVKYQTSTLTEKYRELIDKHILWIRSCEPLGASDAQSAIEAFRWLVNYQHWQGLGLALLADMQLQPWWYAMFLGGLAVILARQSRWRRLLGQYGTQAEKKNCTEFRVTAHATLFTFLIATPVPFILLFAAWRVRIASDELTSTDSIAQFAFSLANGLLLGAALFLPLELLRQVCRPDGLAVKHFDWEKPVARTLAANLRWLINLTIPLSVIIGVMATQSVPRWESSLGRLAFILLMPMFAIFFARVFHPTQGSLNQYLHAHPDGWVQRLSYIWYSALLLFPLAMAVASGIGYHYTALRIASHFNNTFRGAVILLVIYFLAQRWLVANRRKIMLAKARQRLEEAAKREAATTTPSPIPEPSDIDLTTVNEQTRRLLSSGMVALGLVALYLIWSDILPAIGFLDTVKLWSVEGRDPDETIHITLANLLLVIPLVVLLFISARNIPGLLEIGFLQHLPLTSAARYATTTLTRYVIIGVGIVMASSTLGLRWSSIQWLVAALGVGLGFGLQEIFANFVSGVILLFEQPIRVGDIITIDGTTGTVQKIRMRATTIMNWDRQELVVPNKDLITGKLLNWTLTDSTNRIVINVGVAYGSNTEAACELIREICDQHPNVMREPKPIITFEGFGDNSLSIVLRGYLESLDVRLTTIHELHQAIYSRLNSAGIEIAFPQRDIHLRSLPKSLQTWLDQSTKTAKSTNS